jgi:hypothetical protein
MKEEALKVIITNGILMDEVMRSNEKKSIPSPVIV